MSVSLVEVRPADGGRALSDWLRVPARVFAGDPWYVPPLRLAERRRVDPRHNPFFRYGEAAFFLAYRGGEPVGRISAQINRSHLELHQDRTGHFGFFDCLDDLAAAQELVGAAEGWLRRRGLNHMQGPFSLAINQEAGLLVAGFEQPPALMMGHARPWADNLMHACGLTKVVDLNAYRISPAQTPKRVERLAELARGTGSIRIRQLDMRRFSKEVQLVFDIFNDAWSDNWGFVPIGGAEVAAVTAEMRTIMRSKFGLIAEIDGKAAAMLVVLPDLNRVIKSFRGRLLPFNWARLATAISRDRWKTARIPLLGIRKAYRTSAQASAVLSLLVAEILALGRTYDLDWVEFSWVLETNREMVALAEMAAGPPCKVYRIYGKDISFPSST